MANRLGFPRPSISLDRGRIDETVDRVTSWRLPRGGALKLLIFQLVWLPFWIWSDVPAPSWPHRTQPFPPGGLAGDHVSHQLGRLANRIWLLRTFTIIARALWLPILVGCAWLGFELLGGSEMDPPVLLWIGVALLIPALVFAFLVRPTKRAVARMLDCSFGLQDRMVTAVDNLGKHVPAPGEQAPITYLQMADAANIITELKAHPAFRIRPPVREIVLAIASALLLVSLFFFRGVGGGLPVIADGSVPKFVPAVDRLAVPVQKPAAQAIASTADQPTTAEVQAQAEKSNQAKQDLKQIANALSDQAATRLRLGVDRSRQLLGRGGPDPQRGRSCR